MKQRFFLRLAFAVVAVGIGCAAADAAASISLAGGSHARALIIGANKYKSDGIPELHGAVPDAQDIARALRAAGVAVTEIDAEPEITRDRVVREMNKLVAESRSGDLAIISYAGHGARVHEYPQWRGIEPGGRNEEYVLPGFANRGPGTREVVVNKEIKAWLSRLEAKGVETIFVADSCHGGGMTRGGGALRQAARMTRGAEVAPGDSQFRPIDMTPAEARADVSGMPHVTFLSGVDELNSVLEISIPGLPTTRGALSYAFARLVEGKGVPVDGIVTRRVVYQNLRQMIRQYSDGQQDPRFEPHSIDGDPAIFDRPLFKLDNVTQEGATAGSNYPKIMVATINGDGGALSQIRQPHAPFERTADPRSADLVWDIGARRLLSHGDSILYDVKPQTIAGAIDRTSVLMAVKKLSEGRLQTVGLKAESRVYTPHESARPVFVIENVAQRHAVLFNIAANGVVQMLSPGRGQASLAAEETIVRPTRVMEPFGADAVVAVVSAMAIPELENWLWSVDNTEAASSVPMKLSAAINVDPTVRIGVAELFTGP